MPVEVSDAARELGLAVATLSVSGLDNRDYSPALNDWLAAATEQLRNETLQQAEHRREVIAGFAQLRRRVDRSWRRFPASPEVLWQQFQRRGSLGRISPAVDIYNMLSLQTGLSLGGHDLARLTGSARLVISEGGESFTPLGGDAAQLLPAGEYIYRDDTRVLCRMDCRQADFSRLTPASDTALFIVQGHCWMEFDEIVACRDLLGELLERYCKAKAA